MISIFTNTPRTINNVSYEYGYNFERLYVNVKTTDTKLYLYLYANSAVTLYYAYNGSTDWVGTYNVNGSQVVEISLNGNEYVILAIANASVGNIALYYAYAERLEQSTSQTLTGLYITLLSTDSGTTYNPGYLIYQLPTYDSVYTTLYDYAVNNLGYTPSKIEFTKVCFSSEDIRSIQLLTEL